MAASFALAAGGWTIHAINNPDTVEDMPEIDRVKYAQAAPRFNPALWNDLHTDKKNIRKSIQIHSNCYAYVVNNRISEDKYSFPVPGINGKISEGEQLRHKLFPILFTSRGSIRAGAVQDGLIPIDKNEKVPEGYYLAALFVRPGVFFMGGFHWYRLDADDQGNLFWTHKPGNTKARDTDESGQKIVDLRKAERGYALPQFGGYFLIPQNGMRFDPPVPRL